LFSPLVLLVPVLGWRLCRATPLVAGLLGARTGCALAEEAPDSSSVDRLSIPALASPNLCYLISTCHVEGRGTCRSPSTGYCSSGFTMDVHDLETAPNGAQSHGVLDVEATGGDIVSPPQSMLPTADEVAHCSEFLLSATVHSIDVAGNETTISSQVSAGTWQASFAPGVADPLYFCRVKGISVSAPPGDYIITASGSVGPTQLPVTIQAYP
jgi:hypothetical protein